MPYPQEFSPELNEEFLKRLTVGADEEQQIAEGRARTEAMGRGLSGDPYEGAAVGQARAQGARSRADTTADFYYRLAGLGREERLGKQNRGYQVEDRDFAAGEAEKDRAFRERMSRLGFERESELADRQGKDALWGQVIGAAGTVAGSAIGGPLGGMGGSYLSKLLASKAMPTPKPMASGSYVGKYVV